VASVMRVDFNLEKKDKEAMHIYTVMRGSKEKHLAPNLK
jgi:hypothetical protein